MSKRVDFRALQTVCRRPQALEPAQYDTAYAIPSCNEGRGVLKMLHSIAVQKHVDDMRAVIVLCINNRKGADAGVQSGNALTRSLVEALWADAMPDDLPDDRSVQLFPHLNEPYFRAVTEAMLVRGRIELVLVDMHTGDNAPEHCNVGIARRTASETALPLLRSRRGVLVATDADSWLDETFENEAHVLYSDPAVNAATGTITYMPEAETMNVDKLRDVEYTLRAGQNMLQHFMHPDMPLPDEDDADVMMPGVLMTMRPETYRAAGGFDDMPGAEDTALSCKILKSGRKIHRSEKMKIFTPNRISLRTHENHGLGQGIARKMEFSERPEEYPVRPLRGSGLVLALHDALERARTAADEAEWRERMRGLRFEGFEPEDPRGSLTEDELTRLWNDFQRAPGISQVRHNGFIWLASGDIARDRFGSMRMDLALLELHGSILDHEETRGSDVAERLEKIFCDDDDVVEALHQYAVGRVDEESRTDVRRGHIAVVMFGLPHDETSRKIEDYDIEARQLHAMASASWVCDRIRRASERIAAAARRHAREDLAAAMERAHPLLRETVVTTSGGWNLIQQGMRFERGADGDRDLPNLKAPVAERLESHRAMLADLLAEARADIGLLVEGLPALIAAAQADGEDLQDAWTELLQYHAAAAGCSADWTQSMEKW